MNFDKSFIALNASVFLLMIGVGMTVAELPARVIALSGSSAGVGYLAACFAASYLLLQVPAGYAADRFGFKALLVFGYGLSGLTGLVYAIGDTAGSLFLGRFLQGIAEVPVWAAAPALLSLQYGAHKGRAVGIYNAVFHFGLCAGPLIGVVLQRMVATPAAPFLIYFTASFSGAVCIAVWVKNPARSTCTQAHPLTWRRIGNLTRRRAVAVVLPAIMLYGAAYGLFITVIPALLMETKGFGPGGIALFFALFYVVVGLSQLLFGPLTDRIGRRGVMLNGVLLWSIGFSALSLTREHWLVLALLAAGLGMGAFYVASLTHLNETVGDDLKGTISGTYFLAWGLGYFLGPMLTASFASGFGMVNCLVLFAGICIAVCFFTSVALPRAQIKQAYPADGESAGSC